MTRRNWDGEPKSCIESLEFMPIALELRIRRSGWAKRTTEQIQKKRLIPSSAGGNFLGTDALGQIPLHDERWEV